MWNHFKEKYKILPAYLHFSSIKYYVGIMFLLLVIMCGVYFWIDIWIGILTLSMFLILGVILYFSINDIINEINNYVAIRAHEIRKGEQYAYLEMPIGMILYDEFKNIQWINPYFQRQLKDKNLIGRSIRSIDEKLYYQLHTHISNEVKESMLALLDKKFKIIIHPEIRMIYLMDISEYEEISKKYQQEQPVFGQIFLDNFYEISQSLNDRRKSNLNNFVTNQLSSWANHHNIFLKRVDDDRFIAFLNRSILKKLEDSKFDIIDKIRDTTAKQNYPLTVSMGFSYQKNSDATLYHKIAGYAQANLDLALGRGGDQVVVRSENEEARFYGGKSNPMEKRTRVRARMVSQALQDLMSESDHVIIMGHQFPDMDSIGASLGIRRIAKMNQKKAWIVTNPEQYSNDIMKLMEIIKQNQEIASSIISPEEGYEKITSNTLLILVDVSRPEIVAAPELLEKTNKIVIIDHHRRGQEIPKNPVLVYIEPYASSTGELVTELFEYQKNESEGIQPIEATTMLGGIIVDTRNFSLRTGSRTFDAASYLKSVGADTVLIQRLLKENIDNYLKRSQLLHSLMMLPNDIAIVHGEENVTYPTVLAAQTADMMLSMENIDASFVVIKRDDGRVGISARSLGNKNVQRIMEQLGGGGHLSNAAAQLEHISVLHAVEQLKQVINELGNEINL